MSDIECPYCDHGFDLKTADGDYRDGEQTETECPKCDKLFLVSTTMSFYYDAEKADCLNGDAEHDYHNQVSAPREYAIGRQYCYTCGDERKIDPEEWEKIEADHDHPQNWRVKA